MKKFVSMEEHSQTLLDVNEENEVIKRRNIWRKQYNQLTARTKAILQFEIFVLLGPYVEQIGG